MATDLSSYLPAPAAVAEDTTYDGLHLKVISDGLISGFFPGSAATDCDGAFKWLQVQPTSSAYRRAMYQQIIDSRNNELLNRRREQKLLHVLNLAQHDLYGAYNQSQRIITASGWYDVVSATSSSITLKYQSGDVNPAAFPVTINTHDATTGAISGSTTHNIRLPANGLVKVSENSVLGANASDVSVGHGGWIVKKIDVSDSISLDDNFTIHLDTPIDGAAVLTKFPESDSDPVRANVEFYVSIYREQWTEPRSIYPFFGVQVSQDFTLSGSHVITLDTDKAFHDTTGKLFKAWRQVGGSFEDITAIARSGWSRDTGSTTIDFTGEGWADGTKIKTEHWRESSGTTAHWVGQDRCAHCKLDPSSSHGISSGEGNFYCAKSDDASGFSTFEADCYKPGHCDNFTIDDSPTHPHDQGLWKQLVSGYPFRGDQPYQGVSHFDIKRIDTPSLAQLSHIDADLPVSNYPRKIWFNEGGFEKEKTDANDDIQKDPGHEVSEDGTFNHAGNNITSRREGIGTGATTRTTEKQQTLSACVNWHPYEGVQSGNMGCRQRCADTELAQFGIQQVNSADSERSFPGGVLYFGYWNQNRDTCEADDPDLTYRAYIDFDNNFSRYNRWSGNEQTYGGSKPLTNTQIYNVHDIDGNGDYPVELVNQVISCGTQHPVVLDVDLVTSWKSGGTNVAPDERYRVNNYKNTAYGPRGGMNNTAKVGDVALINGSRYAITRVEPYAGGQQNWKESTVTNTTTFDAHVIPYFFAFGSGFETLSSITITRNSGATTLTGITSTYPQTTLLLDNYYYATGKNEDGQSGLFIKFSRLNCAAGVSPDPETINRLLNITVVTTDWNDDAVNYPAVDININDDNTGGMPGHNVFSWDADEDFVSIESAKYTYINPGTGNIMTHDLTLVDLPSDYGGLTFYEYAMIEIDSSHRAFIFGPDHWGGHASIEAKFGSVASQSAYWTSNIYIHEESHPQVDITHYLHSTTADVTEDYETAGRRSDMVWVHNENSELSLANVEAGDAVQVRDDMFAHWDGWVVNFGGTALTQNSDYTLRAAEGELWFKNILGSQADQTLDDNLAAGDRCIEIDAPQADRSSMPMLNEYTAFRSSLERLLDS